MFHHIPEVILHRMRELEALDQQDRADGTPHEKRLRQIPAETGKFLALLAASAPPGKWLEIGTSAGYSTLWLSLAAREKQQKITTFELLEAKAALARHTFEMTGADKWIEAIRGDAEAALSNYKDIAFCFLDAEKDVYDRCYDLLIPRMVPGGILVADNVISHRSDLQPMIDRALADERVDAVIVPIGMGELVCRKK